MIVFHDRKIAIMTPPKCGTHALCAGLALPPFKALTYCGPSRTDVDVYDWHTHIWPNETASYKKLVVVRSPYERLVSLYAHHCADCSGKGAAAPGFIGFVTAVNERAYAPFYWQTLSQWLEEVRIDAVIRHESLIEDLNREGIQVKRLPRLFSSALRKPHFAFYDEGNLALANQWCAEDCERFGYAAPIPLTALIDLQLSLPADDVGYPASLLAEASVEASAT